MFQNQNQNQNFKKIYSRRLAIALRQKGFRIVGTEMNPKRPEFDVYLFIDTPQLREAMTEITGR